MSKFIVPLKELFGAFKDDPITKEEFLKFRKSLESMDLDGVEFIPI